MTTLAQLVKRTSAHFPTNEPVHLGHWATALIQELETSPVMSDPLTNGEPATPEPTDQSTTELAEPFRSLGELKEDAITALAAVMARVADRDVDHVLRNEAAQLIAVAMDWGRTAFALCRLDDPTDAYILAKAVRAIDGDIEPTPGDIREARNVIARMIDGARSTHTTATS